MPTTIPVSSSAAIEGGSGLLGGSSGQLIVGVAAGLIVTVLVRIFRHADGGLRLEVNFEVPFRNRQQNRKPDEPKDDREDVQNRKGEDE